MDKLQFLVLILVNGCLLFHGKLVIFSLS